jgi:hypothetical protein
MSSISLPRIATGKTGARSLNVVIAAIEAALNGVLPDTVIIAGVTGLQDALDLKAPLASPALTGNPTVPTQAGGNNSTRAASTAFVAAAVAPLAPAASPTLTGVPAAPTADPGTNTTQVASTAFVAAAIAPLAPAANPTLTGVPAAPTAVLGTNTTQIATTAFIKAAIDALLAGAPGALDTLHELADALGDDASYAATITSALALKAPLANPALTGTPTAPTADPATNSTQLASTAFVKIAADAAAAASQPKTGNIFAVATLPAAASNVGRVVYCSDGNAGAPCAAISDGTHWKVIALGATCAIE